MHPAVLFLPNLASPATSLCPRLRLKPAQLAHPAPGGGLLRREASCLEGSCLEPGGSTFLSRRAQGHA